MFTRTAYLGGRVDELDHRGDRRVERQSLDVLADLHRRGLKVTLNDHPADGIRRHEEAYPAMARAEGATVIEVNPGETEISDMCHLVVRGTAAHVLPQLVAAAR